MTQRTRKFIGSFAILLLIAVYAWAAIVLFEALFSGLPIWAQLIYFAVAGIGWGVPAGMLIKWMARPDEAAEQ